MKIRSTLVLVILAASISICAAIEYKTLDTQYFKAVYPAYWIVYEHDGYTSNTINFPLKDEENTTE